MGGNIAEARLKYSRDSWKVKAKTKSELIKRQKKRISELEASRSYWKHRFQSLNKQIVCQALPVARHSYDAKIIWLCVWLDLTGKLSFRGVRQVVVALGLYLGVELRVPSASSIRLWVCKYGYFCYQSLKDNQAQWALIADESVLIGQERFLLFLGVNVSEWSFDKPLSSGDVEVLGLSISTSWKSDSISKEVDKVREKYQICYVISDEGKNLQATWKQQGLVFINDCTHLWAKSLERVYKDELDYGAFSQAVTLLRKRWILSKNSFLLPPPLRAKSRFHQVFQYVDWSLKVKQHWQELNQQQRKDLTLIDTYQELLTELTQIQQVVLQLNEVIKIKGLSNDSIENAQQIINEQLQGSKRLKQFKAMIENYLQTHKAKITQGQRYLCCSDIIESIFGRYKQSIANGSQSITELVLALAALGKKTEPSQIKQAMEAVKTKDIYQWKQENTTPSLAKIKHDFFTKNGEKKK